MVSRSWTAETDLQGIIIINLQPGTITTRKRRLQIFRTKKPERQRSLPGFPRNPAINAWVEIARYGFE